MPSSKFSFVFFNTIQKYESLKWDIIMDTAPIDKIIIYNSIFSYLKSWIIGNNIALTIIIDDVLDPWVVLIIELQINPIIQI